jgi:hypothetical protein
MGFTDMLLKQPDIAMGKKGDDPGPLKEDIHPG